MKKIFLPIYFVFLFLSFQVLAQRGPSEALFDGGMFTARGYAEAAEVPAVVLQQPEWSFRVFPNPVSDELRVVSRFETESEVICELRDITGKKVMEENLKMPGGRAETTLNLSDLHEGIYFIRFSSSDRKQQQIIKIQKL